MEPGRQHTAAITWSFATEEIPVIPTDAVTSSSSLEVKEVSLFGIGIFVGDLAAIDLKQGTFYADLQVYLLRYFRTFRTQGAALSEAACFGGRQPLGLCQSGVRCLQIKQNHL